MLKSMKRAVLSCALLLEAKDRRQLPLYPFATIKLGMWEEGCGWFVQCLVVD